MSCTLSLFIPYSDTAKMEMEEITNDSMSKVTSLPATAPGAWSAFPASRTSERNWDYKLYMCAYRDKMFWF